MKMKELKDLISNLPDEALVIITGKKKFYNILATGTTKADPALSDMFLIRIDDKETKIKDIDLEKEAKKQT